MSNVVALGDRAELWAERIRRTYGDGIQAILSVGAELIAAKQALSHGEWGRLTGETTGKSLLPFGHGTGQMLMAIARNRVIANPNHWLGFPMSWRTLYELTKLPEAILEEHLKAGRVHPDMTRAEAQALRIVEPRKKPEAKAALATARDAGWGFDGATGRCTHNPEALKSWLDAHQLTPADIGWKSETDGSLAGPIAPELHDMERAEADAERIVASRGAIYARKLAEKLMELLGPS